jgi:hypothetical protein
MASYYKRARQIAHAALQGYVHAPVGNATHYHANYVVPYWATTLNKNAVIGAHIFYRWRGAWGEPAAFRQNYAKKEADPWALRTAALEAEARYAALAAQKGETTGEDVTVTAGLQELPPELAELVDAEVGPNGTRISMRIPSDAQGKVDVRPQATASPNLSWTLNGVDPKGVEQKPLGADAAIPPNAVAGTPVLGSNPQ